MYLGNSWLGQVPDVEALIDEYLLLKLPMALAPDTPRVWQTWGDVYMVLGEEDNGQYQQAEGAYQRLVELAPNVARYRLAKGLALAKQHRFEESVTELERAAALDNTDAIIYGHLADVYWKLGRHEDAAQTKATLDRLEE